MTLSIAREAQEGPSATEVQAALERMLASEPFRASPQLGVFLRFVVEAVLSGRGASLKGYTIGVEALGRDPRFNPQVDPIVRVEATRLRRAMERYYGGAGSGDPIIIDLPRGSYIPTFLRRTAAPGLPSSVSPPVQPLARDHGMPGRTLLAILLLAALVALAAQMVSRRGGETVRAPSAATGTVDAGVAASGLPHGNGMPTIAIDPLRVTGTLRPGQIAAGSLTEKIRDAFVRFDTINVASAARPQRNIPTPDAQPHADYRLSGSLDYGEGATSLRLELIDTAENTIAWTRTFAFPAAAEQAAAEEATVVALTNTLLQSYGVIRARDRAKQLASPAGDPRYRCVLEAADSFRFLDPAAHDRARACLESLTAADPSFAVGYEFLAITYYREDSIGYPARAGEPPALDRALRAARRAVELAPASGRAYQMLFVVQYARHDVAAAFAAGDKALALNAYDMLTLAEYGGRLIMTGEVERGRAMLRRANESGGVLPPWHHFYLFLGDYLAGDMTGAAFQAEQITADDYPLGLVARAIAANRAGNADLARRAIDRLIEVQPAWRGDARRLLAKSIYQPAIVDRLLHDLAAAGLVDGS